MQYYVILDDDETWTGLEGCRIVAIDDANEAAREALDDGDIDEALELANRWWWIEVPEEGNPDTKGQLAGQECDADPAR